MALKRLPKDVQCVLSASYQINTFKKAVEELVYNALDADSSSIAVRVDIEESTIQVIDNGKGILECDFEAIGRKHMTSKITNLSTLKSAPNTYGYRGESLANIIQVAQVVKITSRHEYEEEKTWVKSFYKGKEKIIRETTKRASKGTTVEIKGFLHNRNIQKKAISSLNELQNIKQFLQHVCLIHNNISMSLRNDTNNEIVFKMHKQRDTYQTLSSLFNIKENEIQELIVEKQNYKVRGLISTTEMESNLHWIFLNGKFICNNSRLHKTIDENFNKSWKNKIINPYNKTKEEIYFEKFIPCYFVFITCPYMDYVISDTTKQLVLEFKNWERVEKLLQKLVAFYKGDIDLKEIPNRKCPLLKKNLQKNISEGKDTRDQVKKIINKILGGNDKTLRVSQLQNGIKGKLMKRNSKKKHNQHTIAKLTTKSLSKCKHLHNNVDVQYNERRLDRYEDIKSKSKMKNKIKNTKQEKNRKVDSNNINIYCKNSCNTTKINNNDLENATTSIVHVSNRNRERVLRKKDIIKESPKNLKKRRLEHKIGKSFLKKMHRDRKTSDERGNKRTVQEVDTYLKSITGTKVPNIGAKKHKTIVDDTRDPENNINFVNYEHVLLPPKLNKNTINHYVWLNMKEKSFKTTYDLVHTILRSQQDLLQAPKKTTTGSSIRLPTNRFQFTSNWPNNGMDTKLTFESHRHRRNNTFQSNNIQTNCDNRNNNFKFITKHSVDNLNAPIIKLKSNFRNELQHRSKKYTENKYYDVCIKETIQESLYTIDFSKTSTSNNHGHKSKTAAFDQIINNTYDENMDTQIITVGNGMETKATDKVLPIGGTYTISPSNFIYKCDTQYELSIQNSSNYNERNILDQACDSNHTVHESVHSDFNTLTIKHKAEDIKERKLNIVFVSKSQDSYHQSFMNDVNPLEMCETILNNRDMDVNEFRQSLNDNLNVSLVHQPNVEENRFAEVTSVVINESVSHHFSSNCLSENMMNKEKVQDTIIKSQKVQKYNKANEEVKPDLELNNKVENDLIGSDNFELKDRLRFLPKGMSQIFAICNTKNACEYNLEKDYFDDSIYNNFANNVQVNAESYEPVIQDVKDQVTINIQKVNEKRNKDNASLIFDGKSLKDAKVLGQVDSKFIAAIMKERCDPAEEVTEYLVLFDQHAVHERIRLEKNLKDYLIGEQWKSIDLDDIIALKLSRDEVLYIHNYKGKFTQFGLEWTILDDCEVLVSAIPEAILGKNPREVEKVMKAVRNLIIEEIKNIKMQQGCVSLYPKSIMNLVFSEACRYAIKFGDTLSNDQCKELLQALSECKTPFQCAHGRPVMAVLTDYRSFIPEYKVNMTKIKQFKSTNNY